MKLWQEKHRAKAENILQKLLENTNDASIGYTPYLRLILKEFICSSDNNLERYLVIDTIIKSKEESHLTLEDFEKNYHVIKRNYNKKKQHEWKFYLPCHLNINKHKINLLETSFSIVSKNSLGELNLERRLRNDPFVENRILPKQFIVLSGKSINFDTAFYQEYQAFILFRSLVEFILRSTWVEYQNTVISKFRHPHWMLVVKNDDISSAKIESLKVEYKNIGILQTFNNDELNKIIKPFLNIPKENSSLELLVDSFRLYLQALDSMLPFHSFLNFWQVIENITLSDKVGGSTDKIVNRLALILNKELIQNSDISCIMQSIKKKRNNIVHKGYTEVDNVELNVVKLFSENALSWLLKNHHIFKTTDHLDEYLRIKTTSHSKRKAIYEVLEHLNKTK